ncbi:hypothetical protein B0J17DRAFT_721183 [Rhizoctonia solani]|nr:hypothetical protein B0J17DRAFT_721183 [Rhizoctonia solani]
MSRQFEQNLFDELKKHADRISQLEEKVGRTERGLILARLDLLKIHTRIDQSDAPIDELDACIKQLDARNYQLNARVDELNTRLEAGLFSTNDRITFSRGLNSVASTDTVRLLPLPLPDGSMPGDEFPSTVGDFRALSRLTVINWIQIYQLVDHQDQIPELEWEQREMLAEYLGLRIFR